MYVTICRVKLTAYNPRRSSGRVTACLVPLALKYNAVIEAFVLQGGVVICDPLTELHTDELYVPESKLSETQAVEQMVLSKVL